MNPGDVQMAANYSDFFVADVESNPHAKRLYDDLLHDYNRLIRFLQWNEIWYQILFHTEEKKTINDM